MPPQLALDWVQTVDSILAEQDPGFKVHEGKVRWECMCISADVVKVPVYVSKVVIMNEIMKMDE